MPKKLKFFFEKVIQNGQLYNRFCAYRKKSSKNYLLFKQTLTFHILHLPNFSSIGYEINQFLPRALQFLIGVQILELSQSELSDYQAFRNFRSQNPYIFSSAPLHPNTSFFLNPTLFTLLVFKYQHDSDFLVFLIGQCEIQAALNLDCQIKDLDENVLSRLPLDKNLKFRVRLAVQNNKRVMSQRAAATTWESNSTLTSFELEPDVEQILLGL